MKETGVYLIYGYRLLKEAFVRCLEAEACYRLCGAAQDLDQAMAELASLPVDVVLIDATGRIREVSEAIHEIRDEHRHLKLLPLGVASESDAVELLEAGADGYLLAEASFRELFEIVGSVCRGELACSPKMVASIWARVAALAEEKRQRQSLRGVNLTGREREVLGLIALGQRNKEIARRLNISLATVKNHVHRILDKLEVKRRHEAIRRACENGLLQDPRQPSPALGQQRRAWA